MCYFHCSSNGRVQCCLEHFQVTKIGGARSEWGAERAKYSQSAEQVLIQRPERWFLFAPVPRLATRWQYKAIHWLKQTEHRKRTR